MSHIQALTIGNARLRFLRAGKCMRQSPNWLWPHSSRHFPDCGIQAEQSGLTELRSRNECLGQLKQLEFISLRIRESRGPEVQMEFLCWPWLEAGGYRQTWQRTAMQNCDLNRETTLVGVTEASGHSERRKLENRIGHSSDTPKLPPWD